MRRPTAARASSCACRAASTVGQTATVNFELLHTPAGWLADWEKQTIEYPRIAVEGATADTGAVAAQTLDDLVVRPDKLDGLTPLLDAEKATFGLADLPTALAYRYPARPFSASLIVERTRPSLMAQVYSFFRIEPDNLVAHYELNYDVREARTRRVSFLLPKETPQEISIRGLGDTVVKEFRSTDDGAQRRWEVQLADRKIGSVRLAIDFQQRYDPLALKQFGVPLVTATEVEYQSAFVSVEGDEELDITLTTAARPVDVGELSASEYKKVGRRVIGAYGYVGDAATVSVSAVRRNPYALPPALVQKARLTTKLAASGRSQSLADFDLVTKATLLEIRLPAGSTLWTISLDEQPTKPQKEGESLLISLPAQEKLAVRTLRVVYETTGAGLSLAGQIEAIAPQLLVRAQGAGRRAGSAPGRSRLDAAIAERLHDPPQRRHGLYDGDRAARAGGAEGGGGAVYAGGRVRSVVFEPVADGESYRMIGSVSDGLRQNCRATTTALRHYASESAKTAARCCQRSGIRRSVHGRGWMLSRRWPRTSRTRPCRHPRTSPRQCLRPGLFRRAPSRSAI